MDEDWRTYLFPNSQPAAAVSRELAEPQIRRIAEATAKYLETKGEGEEEIEKEVSQQLESVDINLAVMDEISEVGQEVVINIDNKSVVSPLSSSFSGFSGSSPNIGSEKIALLRKGAEPEKAPHSEAGLLSPSAGRDICSVTDGIKRSRAVY